MPYKFLQPVIRYMCDVASFHLTAVVQTLLFFQAKLINFWQLRLPRDPKQFMQLMRACFSLSAILVSIFSNVRDHDQNRY